ncbi:uncharacterized protein Dvar_08180 [Desulfosarcina variabilis str. Montpellier]|uniref:hypothetical protein n=1 Tax=Desulfosarcina variabilis TaxID=2300 RepID=UPI003AFAE044
MFDRFDQPQQSPPILSANQTLSPNILASSPQGPAASPLSDIAVSESGAIYFTSPLANNVYQVVEE